MDSPVAVVTGASSGIGLALTQHLLEKGWYVVLMDVNAPPSSAALPSDCTLYIRTDVSSYASQAAAFASAHAWRQRLDFAALNAGIDDRDDIFNTISEDAARPPPEPNMATFHVNLLGVYYGVKLFAHYTSLPSTQSSKGSPGGDIIVTASAAGIYPLPAIPQYAATKHALVGLVRSLAPTAQEKGFTVNAICPDMVPTGLAPPGLMKEYPEALKTPMATMMRAYDELLGLDGSSNKNGAVVEAVMDDVIYREAPTRNKKHSEVGDDIAKLWDQVYRQRNIAFSQKAAETGGAKL
ncbi:uncharacterized protein K452DRAFT_313368 [Aplosporella prunicola CBS 121167]|uniref:15-hydroxyprostaglandin dehydrogenase n=1 Tax=Aplosporella prunicola CBS 121167 TaxID=1176127 RepID=A0A6A6AZ15_9PEZI|nr:uncharacterized protein K452DRAFT_313368 [Aplosporella prunicola CBS 121167]KAF2136244.1 hypothetical protein K452DRAFT_313368 [Aplosporella prunicola CBS 121167]